MVIHLYRTSDDRRKIRKQLYNIKSDISCIIKGESNIHTPTIILNTDSIDISSCNYAYIPSFNRYYFINSTEVITGNRILLNLTVDVLMSFSNDILNSTVIINKQEHSDKANPYINDGDFIATQKEFVRIKEFTKGFNDEGTFILIACGG